MTAVPNVICLFSDPKRIVLLHLVTDKITLTLIERHVALLNLLGSMPMCTVSLWDVPLRADRSYCGIAG